MTSSLVIPTDTLPTLTLTLTHTHNTHQAETPRCRIVAALTCHATERSLQVWQQAPPLADTSASTAASDSADLRPCVSTPTRTRVSDPSSAVKKAVDANSLCRATCAGICACTVSADSGLDFQTMTRRRCSLYYVAIIFFFFCMKFAY